MSHPTYKPPLAFCPKAKVVKEGVYSQDTTVHVASYYGDNYILTIANCINAIVMPTNLVQRLWCFDPHGLLCNAGEGRPRTVAVRKGEEDVLWFNVQVHQGHGVDVLQTLQNRTIDIATLSPLLTDHITRELEHHHNIFFPLKVKITSTFMNKK